MSYSHCPISAHCATFCLTLVQPRRNPLPRVHFIMVGMSQHLDLIPEIIIIWPQFRSNIPLTKKIGEPAAALLPRRRLPVLHSLFDPADQTDCRRRRRRGGRPRSFEGIKTLSRWQRARSRSEDGLSSAPQGRRAVGGR